MKLAVITIILILIIIPAIYGYYGGFSPIVIRTDIHGGEVIVYEAVKGDYKQTKEVTGKVYYALLNEDKIETTRGFGIFYDNPKKVAKDQLRSEVGCLLDNPTPETIARLSKKYSIKTLPMARNLVVEFPMKGFPSIIIGVMRVYPAIEKYSIEHGLKESPIMEIYDVPNYKMIYRKEVVE